MSIPRSSSLMQVLQRRSAIVSSGVLVCLLCQTVLGGAAFTLSVTGNADSTNPTGCCFVDLAGSGATGCCCSAVDVPSGCCCTSATATEFQHEADLEETTNGTSRRGRGIESEICSCGTGQRAGFVLSSDPAVVTPMHGVSAEAAETIAALSIGLWDIAAFPPPTPPPEFLM